ncbi:MAG: GNAT family N-acetyltransferase [Chlamydiales bacterium]|nr:GNAT family N-acetyltransferase [Chlamydiales bacterium]
MNNLNFPKNANAFIEEKTTELGIKEIAALSNEKKKIGYAKYSFCACTLIDIEVDVKYQRLGIGTELFQMAMRDLKSHGCKNMTWVATENSLPFYFQQGAYPHFDYPSLKLTKMSIPL